MLYEQNVSLSPQYRDIFLKIMDAKENSKRIAKKIHRLVIKWCFNIID